MGNSFVNLQLHTNGRPESEVRAIISEAYQRRMAREGFVPLAEDEAEGDWKIRDVYLSPADETPWIAVYDGFVGWEEPLCELVAELSSASGGAAVGVALEDSDVLDFFLYRAGAAIDKYSSYPEYFDRDPAQYIGHPERWRALLVNAATPENLRAVWDERPADAMDLLDPVVTLLGGGSGWWGDWRDAAYARQSGAGPQSERLVFRSVGPPDRPKPIIGPPRLFASSITLASGLPFTTEAAVGDALQSLPFSISNNGGPTRGVRVRVSGSAIAAEFITISRVVMVLVGRDVAGPIAMHEATFAPLSDAAGAALVADLPRVAIPAGIEGEPSMFPARQIGLNLTGQFLAAGHGELRLEVIPIADEADAATWTFPFRITAPPRRPLRSLPDAQSHLLRALEPSSRLEAVIALGGSRAVCAAAAGDAIERWWRIIAPADERSCAIALTTAPGTRAYLTRTDARQLLTSPEWQSCRGALIDCVGLSGNLDLPPFSSLAGFSYGVGAYYQAALFDADAPPYLAFSYDMSLLDDEKQRDLLAQLEVIIDTLMARADGLQAFVARWGGGGGGYSDTLYESACGISIGRAVVSRGWGMRYLRAVTERLWLGPALLARLGATQALRETAELTPVGAVIRLALRPDADLTALELALAPLLPSAEDWQAAEYGDRL